MKLSRRDPYQQSYRSRRPRNPLSLIGVILLVVIVLLLVLSWWNGAERPVTEIELPVSAEQLAG
ncbi:hypothetical protein M2337_002282 [Sphingobium sp. B2D3A]|uniref:hypothetical protein n=1 Tax=Sphingobium TaxID=165695 RepID=UPI0015EB90E6|nr:MULTISPECIES: hypothetical protein [Sphingobium]MCW2338049.1 hypothetical protein [Sphingobium sp. B2D3A]MCW2350321.1 hypothetical protein [Sphingobium sp. B12D2B]MCW2361738.1 hypothetical protein [Sphingobium sp. B10D3B]MCW2366469.1 hypothetical protein [Sphingobium sp. B7D2B]MCW2369425.1 hypothetical protein [Sphingobium sp. B11D3D]